MGKRIAALVASCLASLLLFSFGPLAQAELSIDEIRQLLQESLTVTEIDREVERIADEEVMVEGRIRNTEEQIIVQTEHVAKAREHAGQVLRSYYMGDRDSLWLLLFTADSFADALSVYQYLSFIAESDMRTMNRYMAANDELRELQLQLRQRQDELRVLKTDYLTQRERLIALQQELDRKLAEVENKEALLAEIEKLNEAWKNKGLPLFRQFLDAMSGAMVHLPDYLDDNPDALQQQRRTFLFTIRETELNTFLRKQNPLFERFTYTITDKHIMITGKQDDQRISVKGHYRIEEEPEQALRFILDEMTYNDFVLPDTTRNDMQKQFAMTFYPKNNELTSLLSITSVVMKQGEFIVELTLEL